MFILQYYILRLLRVTKKSALVTWLDSSCINRRRQPPTSRTSKQSLFLINAVKIMTWEWQREVSGSMMLVSCLDNAILKFGQWKDVTINIITMSSHKMRNFFQEEENEQY